jgi:hypothetical protein
MAKHFLLPDVGDWLRRATLRFGCAIIDFRRLANFVQSHTSCNRCNRAILLFGALLMGVLRRYAPQDDR